MSCQFVLRERKDPPITESSQFVDVTLPGGVGYRVHIGRRLVRQLHGLLEACMTGRRYRPYLVTSPEIWQHWFGEVRSSFPEAQSPHVLFVPAGEKHKRLSTVERLAEELAQAGADRDALLIAFGGGVVGDITGFLAAIYMRGVPYVQVPTTLLAQVDSSVGGKTGVNLQAGKNLVGSFHHPLAVFADVDLLGTLPPRELRAGLQESVKAAILQDASFFDLLEQLAAERAYTSPEALTRIVQTSVAIKAEVVASDERESGRRMTLNFGHTLGHAIEAATKYRELLHGEAVAWGSIAALHLGLARGRLTMEQFQRMQELIFAFGPLPRFKSKPGRLVELTATDKKNRGGQRTFVLPVGIGSVEIVRDVTNEELNKAARAMLHTMKVRGVDL